ncbi:hypothetical protein WJX74_002709 [Apatococcus lobatus]|uniref:Uncharacterized protein n=1 Tax=Apatococcus lobatus TaxID=904363 RepID=A0AAW1PYJ6_9CHLO
MSRDSSSSQPAVPESEPADGETSRTSSGAGFAAGTQAQPVSSDPNQDQEKLLATIAGQLAESRRAEREAVRQEVKDACKKQHTRKRKQLQAAAQQEREKLAKLHDEAIAAKDQEREELVRQHSAAMAAAEEMAVRRRQDSEQCAFIVRGSSDMTGSIPRQIFEAEPNSVLNKIYNGEWAHAVDAQGRACINSDPAHWPLILNWLSFGSVPDQPTSAFIAECKYWQLDNLLAKMLTQQPAPPVIQSIEAKQTTSLSQFSKRARDGFQLDCKVHDFVQRFAVSKHVDTNFQAFGSVWRVIINEYGAYLQLTSGPPIKQALYSLTFGTGRNEWRVVGSTLSDFSSDHSGWGCLWPSDVTADKVQRHPYVDLKGSLHFKLQVLFERHSGA